MTPEQYQRVRDIFHAACELHGDDQREYIDRASEGDVTIAAEVRELLHAEAEAARALPDKGLAGSALALIAEEVTSGFNNAIPVRIGHYKILRKIGEGGMGVVYEAQQQSPQRIVALKVLHGRGCSSEQLRKRFDQEAFALGQLRHKGIAQIYESGTATTEHGDIPYLAMEMVDGQTITDAANKLPIDARLTLFAEVCDAVHAAHQRGIIHRDLKPANILVNECGEPKILDFGIARLTDFDLNVTAMETVAGQLIGTLAYMSPEQMAGESADIDIRSDVYTLGVVLYELLAGSPPYDLSDTSILEATRIVREKEPEPLGRTDRIFRGDIETIVKKAMEKDKERRYSSARELGVDLRRYAAHEPVSARPASAVYQLRKLARRNRPLAIAITGIAISLIAGTIISTRLYLEARDAQKESRHEADKAEAINRFLVDDLITTIDPYKDGNRDITMREAIKRAASSLGERFQDQPLVKADIRSMLSDVYRNLGDLKGGLKQGKLALDVLREHPTDRDPDLFVSTLMNVAVAHVRLRELDQAEPLFLEAAKISHDTLGPDAMGSLVARGNLAWFYEKAARYQEAQEINDPLLKDRRRILGPEHRETLTAMNNIGKVSELMGDYSKAEKINREVLAIRRRVLGPDHPKTLISMENLGQALVFQGKLDEAEVVLRDSMKTHVRVLGKEHLYTLWSINNLGLVYLRGGRFDEAETLYQTLEKDAICVLGDQHDWTLVPGLHLAEALLGQERHEESLAISERIRQRAEDLLGSQHWRLGGHMLLHGRILAAMSRYSEAETQLRNAVELYEKQLSKRHPRTKRAIEALAELYQKWGRTTEAEHWRHRTE
jgi:eukaryotic-like serine/threonine-protein kinase